MHLSKQQTPEFRGLLFLNMFVRYFLMESCDVAEDVKGYSVFSKTIRMRHFLDNLRNFIRVTEPVLPPYQ